MDAALTAVACWACSLPSSLAGRPLTPAGKVASAVDEGEHDHGLGGDLIKQSVSQHEKLADRRIPKLWHRPTALAESFKRGRRIKRLPKDLLRRNARVPRDEGDRFVERAGRSLGPNYSAPSSHLRRNSSTTCSWGIVRPASMSARPSSIFCTT